MATPHEFGKLLSEIRGCRFCDGLPLGANPLLQASPSAKILIAGQAPGRRAHHNSVPFDDSSGDRLRDWLGINREVFYDPAFIAIVPMGFCFPGSGQRGDLPPRRECADLWRTKLLSKMPDIRLTVLIGMYAQRWHLPQGTSGKLADNTRNWRKFWPSTVVLPHSSPRNAAWLKNNPHVESEILPALRRRVQELLASATGAD